MSPEPSFTSTDIAAPGLPPFDPTLYAEGEQRYRMGAPLPRRLWHEGFRGQPAQVELVLYVSAGSVPCSRALAILNAILREFPPDLIHLRVLDVAAHIEHATRDRVLFTPTLLCRTKTGVTRVLGDLTNRDVLFDVLDAASLGRE